MQIIKILTRIIFHLSSSLRIFENLLKWLYIFYKIRFTSCVNYCTNWADKIFIFIFQEVYVFRVKNFDLLKSEILKNQAKNTTF